MKEKKNSSNKIKMIVLGILGVFILVCLQIYLSTPTNSGGFSAYTLKEDQNVITLKYNKASEIHPTEGIVFITHHKNVTVYIDGKFYYSEVVKNDSILKTTGSKWLIIPIREEYAGQEIKILLKDCYEGISYKTSLYKGNTSSIYKFIIGSEALKLIFASYLAFISMMIWSYIILKKGKDYKSLNKLAIFTLLTALWKIFDLNLIKFIFPSGLFSNTISYIMLMCMPIAFINYIRSSFRENNKIINGFTLFEYIMVFITMLLQIFNIQDLRQTLVFSHINIVVAIIAFIYLIISNREKEYFKTEISKTIIIVIVFGADIIAFFISGSTTLIGILGITLIMLFNMLLEMKKIDARREEGKRIESIEKMATIDKMTGVYNRNAFEIESKKLEAEDLEGYDIMMVDINNLKYCNDKYGHETGDFYIKSVSSKIASITNQNKIYRIGGDEFIVIFHEACNQLEDIKASLKDSVSAINTRVDGFKFSVAVGIGRYVIGDVKISQILKRADDLMYQDKKLYKQLHNLNNTKIQ